MSGKPALPGVAVGDVQNRDRRLSALLELSRSAIVASDVAHLLPRATELLSSVIGEPVNLDRLIDPNGRMRVESSDLRALSAGDREFVANVATVLGLLHEQRDRDRRAMARVEERFRRIFQHSPVALAISTMDDDGRIVDVNERWLSVFGFKRDEVIGRTHAELRLTEGLTERSKVLAKARVDGIIRELEMKVRTKPGQVIDIVASAVPFDVPGTDRDMWLSALVDITERKLAAAERDQLLAREQLARAEAEQALEKLRAVYAITDSVAGHGPVGDLLSEVLRRLRRTLQIDHATVLLLDDDRKTLHLRAIEGPNGASPLPVLRLPLGVGVSGQVAAANRPMIANNYAEAGTTVEVDGIGTTQAVMAAPFHIGDRVAGVVAVSTMRSRQFTEEELRLLVLAADRVGPAIERGRLIERIRSGIERQRALSRRLLTAQEEERRRLAVELHDELGQVLTAVKINLESLAQAKTPAGTFATMAATIQSVDEALLSVRDLALDLRPSVLDDLGLAAAIRWYVDRFARGGPVETHLSIDLLPALEPELATACFRVAQEALTNVDRHARAHHTWIDLHVLDGALELSVRDDGIGFEVSAARARAMGGASVGLLGMQERVSLVDGEFEVRRVPAGGTEVRARFPLTAGARP
jgi:PAS domain S-box-containing protein